MEQTWRWYGPNDPISLRQVAETGATGIVTSLHQIPGGSPWTDQAVAERKAMIEAEGLTWSVVESIPVTNAVKARTADRKKHVEAWKESLRALGRNGVKTVCYNYMPTVDWTRTDLSFPLRSGAALRFDIVDLVAFDVFDLKRPNAADSYDPEIVSEAERRFNGMNEARLKEIERIVLLGLPGSDFSFGREEFLKLTQECAGMTADDLSASLAEFQRDVVPVAEEMGIRLAIHPDDPPVPLFGLPRIVSTAADIKRMVKAVDSPANGLTFCTGSYGARAENDLVRMITDNAPRIHFLHLRNVQIEAPGVFHEAEHLGGSTNMVEVIRAVLAEEARRATEGRKDALIPMRPDHGHLLSAEPSKNAYPGYSYIGRLKGLAEIRGVVAALSATKH